MEFHPLGANLTLPAFFYCPQFHKFLLIP